MPENFSTTQRNTSIVALNAVSTLSQIGQFGLGTTLLPIALEARHATPELIGLTSAAFWFGMLGGLLVAGQLTRSLGYRNTVILGLIVSAISFLLTPLLGIDWWLIPAAGVGFGLGLRWIANETWLYRLSPVHARGRIIGIHETLIALGSVAGPMIIVALGVSKPSAFWAAAAACMIAIPPLFIATTLAAVDETAADTSQSAKPGINTGMRQHLVFWLGFGGLIAGLGGWIEGSLLALLPVYVTDIGLSSTDTAWLLTVLGIGAMVCQYPIGWLSDHKGVLYTAKLCAAFGIISAIVALTAGHYLHALSITAFLVGGVGGGLLTLGMVWATQHGTGSAITNRVRQVSIIYTTLSALGPMCAGFIVSHTSSTSLFWQQLAVMLVLAAVLLRRPLDK
ncbi:MAG TPA: MFS transporter [Methylophilaceae bacterium]|nr:MFS transporter [Methylophilaceae bacterium]